MKATKWLETRSHAKKPRRGLGRQMRNFTSPTHYGTRSHQCPRCKDLVRPADLDLSRGVCRWCEWELRTPGWQYIAGNFDPAVLDAITPVEMPTQSDKMRACIHHSDGIADFADRRMI